MANDAKFNFYVNRQGPRGQKGEKGDQGFSPSITVNTDTADEYTLLIQNEYNSFVTDNIRPTYDDRGGTYVRVDRANNVQYFGSADIATTANYGEVKLAQASDLASTVDVGNSNVITVELLKTWFDGQLADNLVTTTNNVTIQGQKIFATPTRFMDTVRIGNRLMVTQDDTGTITFDTDETGTLIGTHLTSTGDASFSQNVTVDGTATIKGGVFISGDATIYNPQLGNTTIDGSLTTKASIGIQGQDIHLRNANPTMYLKNMNGVNEIEIFRGLFSDGNPNSAANYLHIGNSQLNLNLSGKAVRANGKDVATADTVEAMQSDLNIAKQDIIEAQGDIDNLQMNKQNKLTAGTGITIDADNVISATGGVVDLPIASSTTLGGIKVGENLTISEDGTLSATGGGTGDVSAAGNNTFTGENTFNGAVTLNGTNIAENLTVERNLTSSGEINAVSIKTTGLRSDDIQTTANKKYLTEVDVDNRTIQVVDGKISSTTPITYLTRAQYDALETKDANIMYVITDEEGGGGSSVTYTAEAPLSISADNVISIDTTGLGGTTLKKDASINVDYALDLTANGTVGGTSKAARAESHESKHDAYMAFSGHNPSDAISTLWGPSSRKANSWVELYVPEGIIPASAAWTYGSTGEILPAVELLASNDGSSYTSLGSVTGVSTVTASMTFNTTDSYKYLRFKFRDACVTSDWGKFGLTSLKVKSSEMATYTELFIGDNIDVTNGVMNVNMDKIGSELSDLSTRVTTAEGSITTLQGEVNNKQDKFDVIYPLALVNTEVASMNNLTAIEPGQSYYIPNPYYLGDNDMIMDNSGGNPLSYENFLKGDWGSLSFVTIPYSFGQMVRCIMDYNTGNNSKAGYLFGYYEGSAFIPVLACAIGITSNNSQCRIVTGYSKNSVGNVVFNTTALSRDRSDSGIGSTSVFSYPDICITQDKSQYQTRFGNSNYNNGVYDLSQYVDIISKITHLRLTSGLRTNSAFNAGEIQLWNTPKGTIIGDRGSVNDFVLTDYNFATSGVENLTSLKIDTTIPTKTSELTNDSGFVTADSNPVLDVPVNNCILAMPTAPTFDGTNVKVYAGTKVAIPNGLNADGTCKSNIVTLTADATINQSTFNGDVTLMLKSDGTIDQTVYSYFEVDDISTITTLTAYCWYYDRKTNNHYLASSTGAKQGPYQRIKIGSYNQAEAATTKYFKTYRPIALEKLDITGSCMPDYSAGVAGTFTSQTVTAKFSGLFVYKITEVGSGGERTISVNGSAVAYFYNSSSNLGTSRCFPVSKGDIISTSESTPINESYELYPFKGVN